MAPLLVSAGWLLDHHHESGIRILDARFKLGAPSFGRDGYLAGHIPSADFVDLESDLHAPVRADRAGGRHPLPDPQHLAVVFSRLGVTSSDHIVAYDDPASGFGFYAPHLWWLLRYAGHDNVSVLDGGLPAWLSAGGALEKETPRRSPAQFAVTPRTEMIVNAAVVEARHAGTALVDSRAPERYRGDVEPLDWKAGHIPGAINRNWADGLESGHWKSAVEQQKRFADLADASEIIVYCGSGVSAGGNMLALALAGIPNAKLYPGSWSDWISDNTRPVAK